MEESFTKYNLPLKYLITSLENDPNVMEDPKRGANKIEKTMGLLWDIIEDTILALPKYNLHGTNRGKSLGPDLTDMPNSEILKMKITRMTFLRLAAQTYSRLGNLLGPLITCIKILASRSCELAGVQELDEDLSIRDKSFVEFARTFIINLKKVKEIRPFKRCWVKKGYQLMGFLLYLDGGKTGLGDCLYVLSTLDGKNVERALCLTNGRLS